MPTLCLAAGRENAVGGGVLLRIIQATVPMYHIIYHRIWNLMQWQQWWSGSRRTDKDGKWWSGSRRTDKDGKISLWSEIGSLGGLGMAGLGGQKAESGDRSKWLISWASPPFVEYPPFIFT